MASKSNKLPRAARASEDDHRMEQAERAPTETFTNEMGGPEKGQTQSGLGFGEQDPSDRIALSDIPRRRLDDDPLAEGASPDQIAEDELLGILESLNSTLDNATTVLAGNHALAESIATSDAGEIGEPKKRAPSRFFAPPALAATLGVGIGVFSLAALWPTWNGEYRQSAEVTNDVTRSKETVVVRQPGQGAEAIETAAAPNIAERPAAEAKPGVSGLAEPQLPEQAAASTASLVPTDSAEAPRNAGAAIGTKALVENKATADIALPPSDEPAALDPKAPAATKTAADTEVAQNEIVTGTIPQAPPPQSLSPEEEAGFAERGKSLIETGDVGSARLIFTYAARRGSTAGMYALGQTYDPQYLAQWKVHGIDAEIDTALNWYMKAAQAGHKEAQDRLKTLIEARR